MTSHINDEVVIQPDPVVEFYKKDVDRAALRENLKLTVEERVQRLQQRVDELGRAARAKRPTCAEPTLRVRDETAPGCGADPVIEAYKKDVDRTLLRENLKLTPGQRVERLQRFMHDFAAIRGAARKNR